MSRLERNLSDQLTILASPGLGGERTNPYNRSLYSNMPCKVDDFSLRRACFGRYAILHLHNPEQDLNGCSTAIKAYVRLRRRFVAIDLMRSRGTKVFWTIHNLASHERRYPRLERWFWRQMLGRLDGYIALTESGRTEAMERFPPLRTLPGFVVPHLHYRGVYPENLDVDARASLGLAKNAKVLVAFGNIRRYKNLPLLIDVFRQYQDPDAILYIAGRPHADLSLCAEIRSRAAGDSRIHVEITQIPNDRVYLYFRSADLAVLPYRDVQNDRNMFNSGIALVALSFNCPILVPNQGAMKDLYVQVGADWVRTFDEFTAAELSAGLTWSLRPNKPAIAPLDHLDHKLLAKRTLDAYECVLSESHGLSTGHKRRGWLVS
jgi:beta-1,4-mannosyltransferase